MAQTSKLVMDVLKNATSPMNIVDIMKQIPVSHCMSTASRALRRMRAKGEVGSFRNGGRYVLWTCQVSQGLKHLTATTQPAKVQVSKPSSKGSSRSYQIMCRPDNMPTLCKAIEDQVAKFIADKKKFSAWDVTVAIRGEVNRRVLDVDDSETGKVYVAGASVAKIDHAIVKECVHDIFNSGEMPGYDREFNGSYLEYAEKSAAPAIADTDDAQDDPIDVTTTDGSDYDGSSSLSS